MAAATAPPAAVAALGSAPAIRAPGRLSPLLVPQLPGKNAGDGEMGPWEGNNTQASGDKAHGILPLTS